VVCTRATLFVHHVQINEAKDAALARAQLETVIDWGRYADLFSYVEGRGIFCLEAPETREEA
jgi:NitT/TauT family transport system ATP-binding protein